MYGTSFEPTAGQFASIASGVMLQLPYAVGDYDPRVVLGALHTNSETLAKILKESFREFIRKTYLLAFVEKVGFESVPGKSAQGCFQESHLYGSRSDSLSELFGGMKWPRPGRFHTAEYEIQRDTTSAEVLRTIQERLRGSERDRIFLTLPMIEAKIENMPTKGFFEGFAFVKGPEGQPVVVRFLRQEGRLWHTSAREINNQKTLQQGRRVLVQDVLSAAF